MDDTTGQDRPSPLIPADATPLVSHVRTEQEGATPAAVSRLGQIVTGAHHKGTEPWCAAAGARGMCTTSDQRSSRCSPERRSQGIGYLGRSGIIRFEVRRSPQDE